MPTAREVVSTNLDLVQCYVSERKLPKPLDGESLRKFRADFSIDKIVALLLEHIVKHTRDRTDEDALELLTEYVELECERLKKLADVNGFGDAAKLSLQKDDAKFFANRLLAIARTLEKIFE